MLFQVLATARNVFRTMCLTHRAGLLVELEVASFWRDMFRGQPQRKARKLAQQHPVDFGPKLVGAEELVISNL